MRVRNGKITEHWGVANLLSLAKTCPNTRVGFAKEVTKKREPGVAYTEYRNRMINSMEVVMKSLVWFITGASRGFGPEIARAALERGDGALRLPWT